MIFTYFSGGFEIPAKRTWQFLKPTANEISVHSIGSEIELEKI